MCGECHRMPDPARPSLRPEEEDPLSVRFAPVGLMASACFRSSGRLSCVTCHDPHDNAKRDDSFYTARCLSCHCGYANDHRGVWPRQRAELHSVSYGAHPARAGAEVHRSSHPRAERSGARHRPRRKPISIEIREVKPPISSWAGSFSPGTPTRPRWKSSKTRRRCFPIRC